MHPKHDVFNQPEPLLDVNLSGGNQALQSALAFNAPGLNTGPLQALGEPPQAVSIRVTVAANAFDTEPTEPTEGILRAASRSRYTLEREDDCAGRLHVYFPRIGFVLREVRA